MAIPLNRAWEHLLPPHVSKVFPELGNLVFKHIKFPIGQPGN